VNPKDINVLCGITGMCSRFREVLILLALGETSMLVNPQLAVCEVLFQIM
jgi:hypothetical protein